jgi:hypothetical protein
MMSDESTLRPPAAPERSAFAAWLRAPAAGINDHWKQDTTMGEHDAALVAWLYQQSKIDRLRAAVSALLKCPSGEYCDAYPAAHKLAQDAMKDAA